MFTSVNRSVVLPACPEITLRWRPVEAAKTGSGGNAEQAAPAERWGASFTALSDSKVRGCTRLGAPHLDRVTAGNP